MKVLSKFKTVFVLCPIAFFALSCEKGNDSSADAQPAVTNSPPNSSNDSSNSGNSGNSLRLKIYSPDGYVFGPYFDNADGVINGRINLNINNPNGIARGTWYYEVYGYSVAGTEDYYI